MPGIAPGDELLGIIRIQPVKDTNQSAAVPAWPCACDIELHPGVRQADIGAPRSHVVTARAQVQPLSPSTDSGAFSQEARESVHCTSS